MKRSDVEDLLTLTAHLGANVQKPAFLIARNIYTLAGYSERLHHYAETDCNVGLNDPRGGAIQLKLKCGMSNSFAGEYWIL